MKKLLALILALMMTVCLFSACEEKENPEETLAAVESLASEALDLLVARDQEALLTKTAVADPTDSANSSLVGKLTAYEAMATKFEEQVDGWEIADELKAEVKEYGMTKADAVYASFKAKEVTGTAQLGEVINANAKADLLNVTGDAYKAVYTDITVYTDGKEIKDMTIDELKVVVDKIFEAIQACVVDTDVAFQYKMVDDAWKINYVGISAAE